MDVECSGCGARSADCGIGGSLDLSLRGIVTDGAGGVLGRSGYNDGDAAQQTGYTAQGRNGDRGGVCQRTGAGSLVESH